MKYFVNFPYTAESLKNEFRALSLKLHPDTGGNAEEFAAMMNEYEQIARNLSGTAQDTKQSTATAATAGAAEGVGQAHNGVGRARQDSVPVLVQPITVERGAAGANP